jgi:hypothetical protein
MGLKKIALACASAAVMSLGANQASALPTLSSIELLTAVNRALPGTNPPFSPTSYSSSSVRSNGAGFTLTGVGSGGISFIWGNPSAVTVAGSTFQRLGTDFSPTASFGVYHGLQTNGQVNTSASDRLFFGSTTAATAGQPMPAGMVSALGLAGTPNFASNSFQNLGAFGNDPMYRVGVSTTGTPVALLRGDVNSPTVLVQSGQTLPGLPTAVATGNAAIQIDSTSSSPGGSDWMTRITIVNDTGLGVTASSNTALVRNGSVLTANGGLVRTGQPILLDGARPNEIWNRLDRTAVSASGSWGFNALGFVSGPGLSTLAVVDDKIVVRQGDVVNVDGLDLVIGSSFGQIAFNDDGDWAMPVGATLLGNNTVVRDLLFVNGKPVVIANVTLYDLDGNPTAVSDFAKTAGRVAITDRDANDTVSVVFQAFISPTSGSFGYYSAQVVVPEPASLGLLMLGALALRRRRA